MNRVSILLAGIALLSPPIAVAPASAATPNAATISATATTASWTGSTFFASNPAGCDVAGALCDQFALTIIPPPKSFIVTVRIQTTRPGDDLDLYVRDAFGNTITSSTTSGGVEEVALSNPPGGTYTVVVQPFFVVPGG